MKIDAKRLLKRLEAAKKEKREKTSLFLSKDVYRSFKTICDDAQIPASTVIEQMMRDFVESAGKVKRNKGE